MTNADKIIKQFVNKYVLNNVKMEGCEQIMSTNEKLKKIADTYGYDAQSRQCIEEMAELTQAINKYWRKDLSYGYLSKEVPIGGIYEYNVIEEIADVQIMLWQMTYFLRADVLPIIEQKLNRQLKRIEELESKADDMD